MPHNTCHLLNVILGDSRGVIAVAKMEIWSLKWWWPVICSLAKCFWGWWSAWECQHLNCHVTAAHPFTFYSIVTSDHPLTFSFHFLLKCHSCSCLGQCGETYNFPRGADSGMKVQFLKFLLLDFWHLDSLGLILSLIQSGASSRAKHGGAYFSAVYGSIEDPMAAHGPYENLGPPFLGGSAQPVTFVLPLTHTQLPLINGHSSSLVTNTLDLFQNKSCCNACWVAEAVCACVRGKTKVTG